MLEKPIRRALLVLTSLLPLLATITARADAVDDFVNAEMAKRHIPGLSLAVVRGSEVEKVGAYGLSNVELNVGVKPETVFQIQSITKTFTSAAILILMEEGKIALEDPIAKHLEGTPDIWKVITIRHLLTHTSGIKDFINEPTASLRIDVSEADVLKATATRPLNFQPGEKYAYCNTNYHLLAMVIRKLTGKSFGEYLKERIFTPLGMSDTRIVSLSTVIPNRASGYAWEWDRLRNGQYIAGSILGYGGGGIISTAPDMAKWAIAIEGEKILKKATWEQAWAVTKLNDGTASGYGLGWGVGMANGHRTIGHTGAHMTGFTSSLTRYRDDGLTVIVLTNAGHANPSRIAQQVAAIYIPDLAPKASEAIEDKDPKVTELVKAIDRGIGDGKLDATPFKPEMWQALSPQLKSLGADRQRDGAVKSVELLSRSEGAGERTFRYRLTTANAVRIMKVTIEPDGKVSGLWIEYE